MPKKFQGMNSKAVEARARKASAAAAVAEQKQKTAEDEYWKDDDKRANRKQQRKESQEQKRLNNLNKKKELGELYKAEEESLQKLSKKVTSSSKISRAEIEATKRREDEMKKQSNNSLNKQNISVQDTELEENVNQVIAESRAGGNVEARSVEDALSALCTSDELDRHPERRMRAAFKLFEDKRLPMLKADNPSMRMSQLRGILKKEWQKSPENPMNQQHLAYNAK